MKLQRRDFLKWVGLGAGAFGAAAVARSGSAVPLVQAQAGGHSLFGASAQGITWEEMDQHHADGVNRFVEYIGQDARFWSNPLEPVMDGDVKVFNITCSEIQWDTGEGMSFPAMAYNGTVPGPEIRVTVGDRVRFVVTNEMSQSTGIHFHGLLVPNDQDGIPFLTQPPITPGSTFTYEFTIRNAGSHMYHSHHNAAEQVTKGLLGALIVEPADRSREPEVTAEYTMILNDSTLGFTLNGKGFPFTQPIVAKLGDRIRVRYMNEGLMIHPMHLHGIPQLVFAKDGFNLPTPFMCDTLNIAPGERYDVLVDCSELGLWAFHCHVLTHAESANGMFGMVTVLIVEE